MSWLRRLFSRSKSSSASDDGSVNIAKVHKKMNQLVSEFASGMINRTQFQELYSHYQQKIQNYENMSVTYPETEEDDSGDQTIYIRNRHMARAQAYAIYDNYTGLPLGTLGTFRLDPALVIPMLSSYRSATKEIFGAGLRLTQIEDGQSLCFVQGRYTTLLAIFSNEPIPKQLAYLDKLHQHFEGANQPVLIKKPIDIDKLIYPHEYFLGKWQK